MSIVAFRPSCSSIQRISSSLSSQGSLASIQTRGYAKAIVKKQSQQGRQGFRGGKDKGKNYALAQGSGKREKKLGAFQPMPRSQLTLPLFQPDAADELSLPTFNPEVLTEKSIGQAMRFPVGPKEPFRTFGVPKSLAVEFRLLSKPCTVVRNVTVSTLDLLDTAGKKSSLETRKVLTGAPGCGKSTLLLQAVEYCIAKEWVVVYIPRAINLVNSTTTHIYDSRTQTYLQPSFTYQTLRRILNTNSTAFSSLQTTQAIVLDKKTTVPTGTSLAELVGFGIKDQSLAPTVLTSLLEELGKQNQHPVLIAVDDFQALYSRSLYRDPQYNNIKSYHLSLPRLLLEYAGGKKSFTRGAVLGAISSTDTTFQLPVELREALDLPYDRPTGPYVKRSPELVGYTKGLQSLPVPDKLTVTEAASLFEIWMKDKAITSLPNDESFLAKYTEASGNARDFVWKGMLSSLVS